MKTFSQVVLSRIVDDSAKRLLVGGPAMTRPFASPECRADFKRRLAEFFGII